MATIIRGSGGGGDRVAKNAKIADTSASNVLYDVSFIDEDGDIAIGTMPNNTATTTYLGLGQTYTIPAGYHSGEGSIVVGTSNVIECQRIIVDNTSTRASIRNGVIGTSYSYYWFSPVVTFNETDFVIANAYVDIISGNPSSANGYIDLCPLTSPSQTGAPGYNTNDWNCVIMNNKFCNIIRNKSGHVYIKPDSNTLWTANTDHLSNPYRSIRFRLLDLLNNEYSYRLICDLTIIHTQ